MPHRAIYLITGVMASGKSTVAQLLATKMEKGVHLRGDVFRRMMVSGRQEMSAQPSDEALRQLQLRYQLAADAAKTYYDNGFWVVLQDNYYGPALPRMVDMLGGRPVRVVVLCPDVETVKRREAARGKTGYTGFTPEALYEGFVAQTPRIGLWLDTSAQTPAQTVEAILLHFADE
ncbi:MAG: AAA family ATPase [Eubacteriales bacterium]|nr:AAA family ATPase [Eubacteriales bacterium]